MHQAGNAIQTVKLPYEYVAREVEKLYQKRFEDHETTSIENHIAFIVDFLHASGWTEEEYMDAWLQSKAPIQEVDSTVN